MQKYFEDFQTFNMSIVVQKQKLFKEEEVTNKLHHPAGIDVWYKSIMENWWNIIWKTSVDEYC